MKNIVKVICVCLALMLLLPACSNKQEPSKPVESKPSDQNVTDGTDNEIAQTENAQRWTFDEFRKNDEDWMFFAPTTDNYMLTEAYEQTQPDTGVMYTLTILRSFDESGKVVAQVQKLTFDVTIHASFCYDTFAQDGKDYPLLVSVGYSVYVGQPDDVVAKQRTKEQFISDYQSDGTKHWLSKLAQFKI